MEHRTADTCQWRIFKNDINKDGILDLPLGRQFNVINRWKYMDNNGWIGHLLLR